MPRPNIIPGLTIEVVAPHRPGAFLKAPWLLIDGPAGASLSTPPLTRESADAMRLLADDIDAAWAKMDRRTELDAQPEDDTAYTSLPAGLPAFAPHVEG